MLKALFEIEIIVKNKKSKSSELPGLLFLKKSTKYGKINRRNNIEVGNHRTNPSNITREKNEIRDMAGRMVL